MKKIYTIFAILILTLLSSCAADTAADSGDKPRVYASFYAMYDFARMIGGDSIELTCMIPPGTEAHDWEPSPSDIAGLEKADMLIYSGTSMEHWTDSVLPSLSNKKLLTVTIPENGGTSNDPHKWLSPEYAAQYMEAIKDALCEVDPENAQTYSENYEKYSGMALELSDKLKTAAAGFKSHDIVVSHEAYGYLCELCGINQLALEGTAGESDPSPSRMAELARQIKEKDIRYIFTEPGESSKSIDTLAAETGAEVLVLNPFEFDENGRDYFTVMEENLDALKKALD